MTMPKFRSRLALFGAVVSLAAGILAGAQGIGSPLRWVQLIGLIAAGVAFGAGVTSAVRGRSRGPRA